MASAGSLGGEPQRMSSVGAGTSAGQASGSQAGGSAGLPPCQLDEQTRKLYTPDGCYRIDDTEIGCAERPKGYAYRHVPASAASARPIDGAALFPLPLTAAP